MALGHCSQCRVKCVLHQDHLCPPVLHNARSFCTTNCHCCTFLLSGVALFLFSFTVHMVAMMIKPLDLTCTLLLSISSLQLESSHQASVTFDLWTVVCGSQMTHSLFICCECGSRGWGGRWPWYWRTHALFSRGEEGTWPFVNVSAVVKRGASSLC